MDSAGARWVYTQETLQAHTQPAEGPLLRDSTFKPSLVQLAFDCFHRIPISGSSPNEGVCYGGVAKGVVLPLYRPLSFHCLAFSVLLST